MKPLIPRFGESVDSQEKVLRNFKKITFLDLIVFAQKLLRRKWSFIFFIKLMTTE